MRVFSFFLWTIFFTFLSSGVFAQPSPGSDHADVSLIPADLTLAPGSSSEAGLHFVLDEGWHTYWMNPGDSGTPSRISWSAPEEFTFDDIRWPYPTVFQEEHLITHGYKDETMLFIAFSVSDNAAAGAYEIEANLEYLVCSDVCLPAFETHSFTIEISESGTTKNEEKADTFARFRDKLPVPQGDAGIETAFTSEDNHLILRLKGDALPDENSLSKLTFFPHQDDISEPSGEQVTAFADDALWLRITQSRYRSAPPESFDGVLVIETDEGVNAVEVQLNR